MPQCASSVPHQMLFVLLMPLLIAGLLPQDSHLVTKRQVTTTCLGGPPLYFVQDFEGLALDSPAQLPSGWTHDLSLGSFWRTSSSRSGDHSLGTPAGVFLAADGTAAVSGCWDVGTDVDVAFVSVWYQIDAGISFSIHQSVDSCATYSVPLLSASSLRPSLWSLYSGTVTPSSDGTVCLRFSTERPGSVASRVALKLDDVVVSRTYTVSSSLHCPNTLVVTSGSDSAPTAAPTGQPTVVAGQPSAAPTPSPTGAAPTTGAPNGDPTCCCYPLGSAFNDPCIVILRDQCTPNIGSCTQPASAAPSAAPTTTTAATPSTAAVTPAPTFRPTPVDGCCCYPLGSTVNTECVPTTIFICQVNRGSCTRPFPEDPVLQQPPGPLNNDDTVAPTAAPTRAPASQGCMDIGTTPLVVDQSSIDLVLANLGPCGSSAACVTDVNLDTVTDQLDVLLLQANLGPLPDADLDGLADNGCDEEVTDLADDNTCTSAADCADGDACTDDFCVSGFCIHPQFACRGSPCRDIQCFSNPSGTIRQCIEQGDKPEGTLCLTNDSTVANATCQSGVCTGGSSICDSIAGATQLVTVRGEISPIHSTPPSTGTQGLSIETSTFEPEDFNLDIFILEVGCLAEPIPDFTMVDVTYAVTTNGFIATSFILARRRQEREVKPRRQARTVKLVTVNFSDLARGARRSQTEILSWAQQELGPRLTEVTLGKLSFTFEQFTVDSSHSSLNCNSDSVSLLSSRGSCVCCTPISRAVERIVGSADHLLMIFDDAYFGSSGFAGLGGRRGVWMPHEHLFGPVSLHEVFHSLDDLWQGSYAIPGHGNAFLKQPWYPAVYSNGVTYNEYADQACILGSSPWDVGLNAPMLDLLGLFSSSEIRAISNNPQTVTLRSMYASSPSSEPRALTMSIGGVKYHFSHRGHTATDKTAHLPRSYGAYWNNLHIHVGDQERGNSYLLRRVQLGESWTDAAGTVTISFTFASETTVNFQVTAGKGRDSDGDGVPDADDLCPNAYNPRVQDIDQDGVPDACDTNGGWTGQQWQLTRRNNVSPSNVQCKFQDPKYNCDIYWVWGACDTEEQSFVNGESVYCGADQCAPIGNTDATGNEFSDDIDTDGDLLLDCVDPAPMNPLSSNPTRQPTNPPTRFPTRQPTRFPTGAPTAPPSADVPLEGACLVDANGDGFVGTSDLSLILVAWNTDGGRTDFDGNGVVDLGDLALLLSNFNQQCTNK